MEYGYIVLVWHASAGWDGLLLLGGSGIAARLKQKDGSSGLGKTSSQDAATGPGADDDVFGGYVLRICAAHALVDCPFFIKCIPS